MLGVIGSEILGGQDLDGDSLDDNILSDNTQGVMCVCTYDTQLSLRSDCG